MSIASLTNALSGLKTSQQALGVISDNIANANTEGYTRKIARPESVVLDGRGSGVKIGDIQRQIDEYLMADRREEVSDLKMSETLGGYYDMIQDFFGRPGDNNSISAEIQDLHNLFEDLELNPEDSFKAKLVVDKAVDITEDLETMHFRMQDLRARADMEIGDRVSEINELLDQIDTYNVEIVRDVARDMDTGGLRDKRDVALNRLAEIVDINYFYRDDGDVAISTRGGATLLDVDPQPVSHDVANALRADINYDPDKQTTASATSGTIDGIYVGETEDEQHDITSSIKSGELKALIDLRDSIIPALSEEMDRLAQNMRDEINAVHNLSTAFPPPQQLNGSRAFVQRTGVDTLTRLNQDAVALNGDGVIRVSMLRREPSTRAGEVVRTMVLDMSDLRASYDTNANTNFDLEDLEHAILNTVADDGSTFGTDAAITYSADGQLQIEGTNGTTYGLSLDEPTQAWQIRQGAFTASDISGNLPAAGQQMTFEVDGVQIGQVTFDGTEASAADVVTKINAIDGITAFVQTVADPAGGAATTEEIYVTPDEGGDLTITDGDGSGNNLTGYTFTEEATGAYFNRAFTKGFPSMELPMDEMDRVDTESGNLDISLTASGGTLTLSGIDPTAATIDDIRAAIDGQAVGTTTLRARLVNEDGYKLEIFADDNSDITFSGTDIGVLGLGDSDGDMEQIGFSHYFGLNDFFTTSGSYSASSSLEVASAIQTEPDLVAVSQPINSFTSGADAISAGNNLGAQALADVFLTDFEFQSAGNLPEVNGTFTDYATRILSDQSIRASMIEDEYDFREEVVNELEHRIEGVSGVNIDEELSNMILFQNAFTASARVISASQELMDELVNLTR